jgi:hypothetical protein
MKLVAEAFWDLDEKRRVCLELTADEVEPENFAEAAAALAEAAVQHAAQGYAQAMARHPEITGKRPKVPTGFQE